jgi:hypothetical protein
MNIKGEGASANLGVQGRWLSAKKAESFCQTGYSDSPAAWRAA